MKWAILPAALVLLAGGSQLRAKAPLNDPVTLNIGFVCQWQQRCMAQQKKAMKRALKYLRNEQPPEGRLAACNRNASRSRYRVDWVGFDNCIRNSTIRPVEARSIVITRKRARRISEGAAPAKSRPPVIAMGERG